MSQPRNMAASVKDRLLQIARARREEFQSILTRYAIERFLYRLSQSPHRQNFVLKGANVFTLWLGAAHRPTRDLDFLAFGSDAAAPMVNVFQSICRQAVEDDGLVFEPETVAGMALREQEKYAGLRLTLRASLGKAVIPLQIDIGFGDVVTPAAQEAELPTMLTAPSARLLVYPRETVVAEKCEAMVDLGLGNSRLKDFYDLWHLATHFDFEGLLLCRAIAATFQRRGTTLSALPPALTADFYEDASRRRQWASFWEKIGLPSGEFVSLDQCIHLLNSFLLPPLQSVRDQADFDAFWRSSALTWQAKSVALRQESG